MAGRVRVISQARMGSSRLPGKVKASLAGRPLLEQVVRRLQSAARRLHRSFLSRSGHRLLSRFSRRCTGPLRRRSRRPRRE